MSTMSRAIILSASAAVLAGVFILTRPDQPPPPAVPAAGDTLDLMIAQRSKGDPRAPIAVFEMSDFQCPFCRRFALETFPALERQYVATGKVRWTFVNFPISQIHPNAVAAAEFAMCAARANRFWPVHDLIFQHQDNWKLLSDPGEYLLGLADSAGVRRRDIVPCLEQGLTRELVRTEAEEVASVGIQSTPTFVIDGKLLRGAAPLEVFTAIFDSVYKAKTQSMVNGER